MSRMRLEKYHLQKDKDQADKSPRDNNDFEFC